MEQYIECDDCKEEIETLKNEIVSLYSSIRALETEVGIVQDKWKKGTITNDEKITRISSIANKMETINVEMAKKNNAIQALYRKIKIYKRNGNVIEEHELDDR